MGSRLPPPAFIFVSIAVFGAFELSVPNERTGDSDYAMPSNTMPPPEEAGRSLLPSATDLQSALAAFAANPLLAEGRSEPSSAPLVIPAPLEPSPVQVPEPEPEPAPVEVETPILEPPNVEAAGLLYVHGSPQLLVRDLEIGTETWLAIGDKIENWTLVEITQVDARLETESQQITIPIFKNTLP